MSDNTSSENSSDKVSVKLDGPSNYIFWPRTILGPLMERDVLDHITGGPARPTRTESKDNQTKVHKWHKADNRAKGITHRTINSSKLTVLGDRVPTMTAKEGTGYALQP